MIPPKLKAGDEIRIVAPSHSIPADFSESMRQQAIQGLEKLGLKVTFGKYVDEVDEFETTTVEHRLIDLHEAFADPEVKAVLAATGGSSVTQILSQIDYDLVRRNPKILCGLSDVTALSYAMYSKTGITNYYGPHFTMLGASQIVDYSFESMKVTLMEEDVVELKASPHYNNAPGENQTIVNEGFWAINDGEAEASGIGGNFLTTNFVKGSKFMPDIANTILFMEENYIMDYKDVQNELQSILHYLGAKSIKGLMIGRFQRETGMTRDLLTKIIKSKKELESVPVIANVDFGHTAPMLTLPVGGTISMKVNGEDDVQIKLLKH